MIGAPSGDMYVALPMLDEPVLAVPVLDVPVPVDEVLSVDDAVPVPLVDRLPVVLVPLLLSDDEPLALVNCTLPVAMSWPCGGAGTVPVSMLDVAAVLVLELALPLLLMLPVLLVLIELVALPELIVQVAEPLPAAW